MSRKRIIPIAVFAVLSCLIFGLLGCGGGGGGGTLDSGTGQLQINLVDAPLDAEEINVTITSVQVHKSGGGWTTVQEFTEPLTLNLLDYSTSGSSYLLADSPLDAGQYTMIRLMLSSAEIVIGGQSYPVDISNVQQTGVKCNGQFTVGDGQLMALMLDFNAGKSFINTGSGSYKLHPVMTMSPVNVASEVIGRVELQDALGGVLELPAGVEVNVYTAGHSGDATYLVSGALVEADGSFRISVLPQGSYDFEVVIDGTVQKQMAGVAVTPPSTDLGTIVIQQAAEPEP